MFCEKVNFNTKIRELLRIAPVLCASDAQFLLREAYETASGIHDHDVPSLTFSPYALVAYRWNEDATTGSTLHERMKLFFDREVYKYSGVSWNQFKDNTTDENDEILRLCGLRQNTEGTVANNILKELEGK